MSQSKRILVTMATGNQGASTVRALAKRNAEAAAKGEQLPYAILAVTRSTSSSKAQKLAELPGVELLESEYYVKELFAKATASGAPLYGVFSVQSFMYLPKGVAKGPAGETELGIAVADEAKRHNVQHLVYTSVDQGGLPKTDIPHFESKRFIEEHVRRENVPATILRPTGFMDNLSNGETMFGRVSNSLFQTTLKKPIQLIAASDIGEFAARAFDNKQEYLGKTISLAGDELSPQQINEAYRSVKGKSLPTTYSIFPWLVTATSAEMRSMFRFFNGPQGYTADIAELRKVNPELKTFKQYVETEM